MNRLTARADSGDHASSRSWRPAALRGPRSAVRPPERTSWREIFNLTGEAVATQRCQRVTRVHAFTVGPREQRHGA